MQTSATRPASLLPTPASSSMIEKLCKWFLRGGLENPVSHSRLSERLDLATLETVYRLAQLLTVSDAAATDLVGRVYRKAAVCGQLTEECTEQKMQLFKHLHFLFQQDSERRSDTGRISEINNPRSSDPTSVLNLIRQQEPIARLLIFLRHCEGLPLDQISRITGQAPIAIQSSLREFRSSLRRFHDNGSQPAMDWSNVSPARSSQSA